MLCNKNTCKAFYGIYIMLYVKNNCGFKFLIIQTSQNKTKQQQQKITQQIGSDSPTFTCQI